MVFLDDWFILFNHLNYFISVPHNSQKVISYKNKNK